jgi:hypothetical protein
MIGENPSFLHPHPSSSAVAGEGRRASPRGGTFVLSLHAAMLVRPDGEHLGWWWADPLPWLPCALMAVGYGVVLPYPIRVRCC